MNNNTLLFSDSTERGNLSQLPILLAGPILRRVEPNQVCIWIASSKAVSIGAEVFRLADLNKINTTQCEDNVRIKPIGLGTTESIRLGEQLYIGLVIVCPIQPDIVNNSSNAVKISFPTDELLAYDIEVTYYVSNSSHQKESKRLKDFGLLSGKNTIAYKVHIFPVITNPSS
jgi:hypothetical protein